MAAPRVVASVLGVLLEADRIRDLDRHRPDGHIDAEPHERLHDEGVKIGHRSRFERHGLRATVRAPDQEAVVDEIEIHREGGPTGGEQGCREPARGDAQRDIPVVVDERSRREADLPHDLRPHVERRAGVAPVREGEGGPLSRRHRGHRQATEAAG